MKENVDTKNFIDIKKPSQLALLDKENDVNNIIVGTKTYDSVLANYPKLNYQIINQGNWLNDSTKKWVWNRDTIFFSLTNDVIKINHWFQSTGKCWNYYPYLKETKDTIHIYNPEQRDTEIEIKNNDTVYNFLACATSTIGELIIKIPNKKNFHHKVIKYKDKYYKIR
ncbi:MAG: hypothetical protein V4547_11005 [Bacteroidota bacterium]